MKAILIILLLFCNILCSNQEQFQAACKLFKENQLQDAEKLFNELTKSDDFNIQRDSYRFMAEINVANGNYSQVLNCFHKSVDISLQNKDSKNLNSLLMSITDRCKKLFEQTKNEDFLIAAYQNYQLLFETTKDQHLKAFAAYYLADLSNNNVCLNNEDINDVIHKYKFAFENLDPQLTELKGNACYQLALLYHDAGNSEQTIIYLKLSTFHNNSKIRFDVYRMLAKIFEKQKNFKSSVYYYELALMHASEKYQKIEICWNLAQIYKNLDINKCIDYVLELFKYEIKTYFKNDLCVFLLNVVNKIPKQRYQDKINCYSLIIDKSTRSDTIFFAGIKLAYILKVQEKYPELNAVLNKVLKKIDPNDNAKKQAIVFEIACVYWNVGGIASAMEFFNGLLNLNYDGLIIKVNLFLAEQYAAGNKVEKNIETAKEYLAQANKFLNVIKKNKHLKSVYERILNLLNS